MQEEDRIITKEITVLKQKLTEKDISTVVELLLHLTSQKRKKEYVMRLMYIEMLGYQAPWGYINAVNITQEKSLSEKRTGPVASHPAYPLPGYLAASIFFHSKHELLILLVNTIQRVSASPFPPLPPTHAPPAP
jgi:AP-4 complex subunit epsilon-1